MVTQFSFERTAFDGAYLITPFIATDERGAFVKDYSEQVFAQHGITHELKEVFYTYSEKGVIRAIHFQRVKEQAKLVRCVHGKIYDVIVDLRHDSKTYGQWQGFELSGDNRLEILVPEHFGHGYYVIEPSIVSYKCAERFYGEYDDGIMWDDSDIGIKWPISPDTNIIISEKDQNLQSFRKFTELHGA